MHPCAQEVGIVLRCKEIVDGRYRLVHYGFELFRRTEGSIRLDLGHVGLQLFPEGERAEVDEVDDAAVEALDHRVHDGPGP